ncbi:MAG: stage V sporulation protein E [Candidatus Tagabacteria bacterium CG09_land_8_20_14_0_10_41_14]|uniref:Probable peptidoglycan glycosyltransferase FtsW n=1 Tax=Candidatus Tagabacteria bacterium CG09_land_8_20_14_0_10_41_14 TaxID=1975021 RepID=A0A2H0WLT5_9BACT|nr:MAG: stage V sporulation protein E [Candidatus Tagabacteria bacterium CG09_land_8_20_14_0_10_41_14]
MATKKHDKIFLGIVLTLIIFGFLALSSASLGLAARENNNSYTSFLKQIILGGGAGILLFFITSRIPYQKWKTISLPLFLLSICITLLVFEPHIGITHGGAQRWLSLGIATFQPAELLKISFVLYLSSWLSKRGKEISSFKTGVVPFLIIMGLAAAALIAQPDMGTMGVIYLTGICLFVLAGAQYRKAALISLVGVFILAGLIFFKPYLIPRINVFFDASYDLQGAGYQLNQSKIALGSGGLLGRGFGKGLSKFNYLPEPTGDSIFAVIGEEFGFIGTSLLIVLFLIFFYRALRISTRAPNMFGRLASAGIAIIIVIQSFINMYAVVGLIPLTGLPLIFISQGGSALALTLGGIGIIYNISKYSS